MLDLGLDKPLSQAPRNSANSYNYHGGDDYRGRCRPSLIEYMHIKLCKERIVLESVDKKSELPEMRALRPFCCDAHRSGRSAGGVVRQGTTLLKIVNTCCLHNL